MHLLQFLIPFSSSILTILYQYFYCLFVCFVTFCFVLLCFPPPNLILDFHFLGFFWYEDEEAQICCPAPPPNPPLRWMIPPVPVWMDGWRRWHVYQWRHDPPVLMLSETDVLVFIYFCGEPYSHSGDSFPILGPVPTVNSAYSIWENTAKVVIESKKVKGWKVLVGGGKVKGGLRRHERELGWDSSIIAFIPILAKRLFCYLASCLLIYLFIYLLILLLLLLLFMFFFCFSYLYIFSFLFLLPFK